ncbi:MAG: ComF family protein [Alphaproteobacteria bacterium]|nr:MAG: ComF family protein [Alphaproteobacteria bacterium]
MLLNTLIPPRCICAQPISHDFLLCGACWKQLNFITHHCNICGTPYDPMVIEPCGGCKKRVAGSPVYGTSLVFYEGLAQTIITHFKYQKRFSHGAFIANHMYKSIKHNPFDAIIPVPMSFRRLLLRGYHHTAILAQHLSRLTEKPLLVNCLKKRHTKTQVDCKDKKERLNNLKHAFYINEKNKTHIEGKKILLVDDVITTGTTIYECAKILKKAGAFHVSFVTFARSRPSS